MGIDCIVLDFDGTFTEVASEAAPFVVAYRRGLEAIVGAALDADWDAAAHAIEAEPWRYGWDVGGRIVAPAHADPYIRTTTTANLVLDRRGLLADRTERTAVLGALFRDGYAKSDVAFRAEARDVVEALLETGVPVFVVTNSHTEAVRAKIDKLAPHGVERLRVFGDARKFALDAPARSADAFEALPERVDVEGLPRPLYVRRGPYFDVLRAIWDETGARAETTLVCGDIYELDLAMPARLGTYVHLVARDETAGWERREVLSFERGAVSADLGAVVARVRAAGSGTGRS